MAKELSKINQKRFLDHLKYDDDIDKSLDFLFLEYNDYYKTCKNNENFRNKVCKTMGLE